MLKTLFRRKTFSHGLHPAEHKDTAVLAVRRLPFAPRLTILLSQHTGAPAVAVVREGQEVVRGEPIARADGFVSVPMHAPVTGIVEKIGLAPTLRGEMGPAIVLRAYPSASQEILYGAPQNIDAMTPPELVKAVQETGVVGLGGAAFPTHVKLAVSKGRTIDTVIVNGCECEPYLTSDHRVMLEWPDDIHKGIKIVQKAVGADRAIVAIEDNKMDAVEALERSPLKAKSTSIAVLPTHYPQGAETMIIKVVLDREVPAGGLPADVGAAVFNVATLAQLGELLPRHQGLIERVITIAGPGVERPGNYLSALGSPLAFVLEQVGLRPNAREVILGGPMMGPAVTNLEVPLTKGITGILVLPGGRRNGRLQREYPCIKCGRCVEACPLHLNPSRLGLLARKGRYEEMETEFHLNTCFECGCCSYVCPSNIPLVQMFRVAKQMNRERKASCS
jgi:electron transport complex protein RnfC